MISSINGDVVIWFWKHFCVNVMFTDFLVSVSSGRSSFQMSEDLGQRSMYTYKLLKTELINLGNKN